MSRNQSGLALILLRRRRTDLPRPYRSPWYPAASVFYSAVAAIIVVASVALADQRKTGIGLAVLGRAEWPIGCGRGWRRRVEAVGGLAMAGLPPGPRMTSGPESKESHVQIRPVRT